MEFKENKNFMKENTLKETWQLVKSSLMIITKKMQYGSIMYFFD